MDVEAEIRALVEAQRTTNEALALLADGQSALQLAVEIICTLRRKGVLDGGDLMHFNRCLRIASDALPEGHKGRSLYAAQIARLAKGG